MNRRQATAGVVLAAGRPSAVEPVAAQSINKTLIESLNRQLLYVAVPLAILVEVILFYAVWKHKDNDDPSPTKVLGPAAIVSLRLWPCRYLHR